MPATSPMPSTGPPRVKCSAHSSRTGKPCKQWAVRGATVCAAHGGRAPQVKAAAARRLALGEAIVELEQLGRPIEIEPADAMLEMVYEAAGNVAFYRRRVQDLDQLAGGPQGEDILAVLGGGGKEGREISSKAPPAIVGRVDPRNWRAERHVLVGLYDEERERLMRWSKMCRDAGVDERRIKLAEAQGRQLGLVLQGAMRALLDLVVGLVDGPTGERIRAVWGEQAPTLVREQIVSVTAREVTS